jgi:hypothetical protein
MEELKNILKDLPTFWWKMVTSGRMPNLSITAPLASCPFISLLLFSPPS